MFRLFDDCTGEILGEYRSYEEAEAAMFSEVTMGHNLNEIFIL